MSSSDECIPLSELKKRKKASSDSDFDDDVPLVQIKKKAKTTTKKKSTTKKTTTKKKSSVKKQPSSKKKTSPAKKKPTVERKLKVHGKSERLDMAIKAYRWWHAEELPEGIQWRKFEHNGVLFPPLYEANNIPLVYDGEEVVLTREQEELAHYYAGIAVDGPQLGNEKTAKIFNKNFFKDFRDLLGKDHKIQSFEKCDFSKMREYIAEQRELKKAMTKEEKQPEKDRKLEEQFRNGIALVDGHVEKVGNFRIEPPGLFRGRGEHPKTGTFKKRVDPEEVTINVGIGDRIPSCPIPRHAWKEVIHRDTVTWLAYWQENVMNAQKYVYLAASSSFKGKSDMEKYEKARRLKKYIHKIRKDYKAGLKSTDMFKRQRSTAMWVIDILALRVGNEKGEDEADTVGCCSLRVEHISFEDENSEITLSFLGKDSMPYNNTIQLHQYDVGDLVYQNLKDFCDKKEKHQDIFNELTPTELNKHLSSLMPGLSAKVFRTYNASITLEQELPKDLVVDSESAPKVVKYNDANRKVAILCNHQRTVSKGFQSQMERMTGQLQLLQNQLQDLNEMKKKLKKGAKKDYKDFPIKAETEDAAEKKAQAHLFTKVPSDDQVQKRIESWEKKIKSLEFRVQDKEDNKEVALGTSKINYMDPRITVAWAKRNEVPISAVFAKTLKEKFVWAMDVPPDWAF